MHLRCRQRALDLSGTAIMGVINLTPDSFSDGGELTRGGAVDVALAVDRAAAMVDAGAHIIDVGGESTRPGAASVSAQAELDRVMPVVEGVSRLDTIVSVDTSKTAVARECLEAGCALINDVRAGADTGMLELVAASQAAVCLMHMQGEPRSMQRAPSYGDVVDEVHVFLVERVAAARAAGIADDRIVVDPGFGFGKTLEHNLTLLAGLGAVRVDGVSLLVGVSRKSMIGTMTGREVDDRVAGSVAAALYAAARGADIVRVHDVAETRDALAVWERIDEMVA